MLLTALTRPLLMQGARAAAEEAQAQPLAPRRQLPPPARASMKAARAPMKAVEAFGLENIKNRPMVHSIESILDIEVQDD